MSTLRRLFRPEVDGRYFFVRNISSGGMGQVDLIVRREGSFSRLYAAKQLHAQYRDDSEFRAMFLDEARVAGLIHHPHVVSVLDFAEHESGPYLVMEYVDGVSLKDFFPHAPVPIEIVLELGRQTALGLHAAHELRTEDGVELSLVHRDVSPQNILVGYDALVRVTDFGIAKMYGRANKTATGVLKGKFGYMSPEQLRFEPLDRRSDLFSLGVVIFELLAGRRLYSNRDGNAPRRILHDPVPDIGMERESLPSPLVELLFELLAKDPESRPDSARIVAERLARIHAHLEGAISLGDYVDRTFADHREHNTSEVSRALGALRDKRLAPWPAVAAPVTQTRRWIAATVLLSASATALGVAIGSAGAEESEQPSAASAAEPVAMDEALAPVEPSEPVLPVAVGETSSGEGEPTDAPPSEGTEPSSGDSNDSETTPARRSRRAERRTKRRAAQAALMDVEDTSTSAMASSSMQTEMQPEEAESTMVRRRWGFQGGGGR